MRNFISYISVILVLVFLAQFFISSKNLSDDEIHKNQFKNQYAIFSLVKPKRISFCNEEAPLYAFDIYERMDKELLKNTYWQSNMLLYIKRANKYFPVIESILAKNKIPDDFKYLALIESGLENVVSPAGATGFWQILKSTAREYDLEVNSAIDERYHLEKSTQFACDYLNEAYSIFGSWTMAAASYNMGMNGLKRTIEKQKTKNYYNLHLNSETSRYIFRILAVKEIMENAKDYGFVYRTSDLYNMIEYRIIHVDSTIADLYAFAKQQGVNYKLLKQMNPWLLKSTLPDESRKRYEIKIPIDNSSLIFSELD